MVNYAGTLLFYGAILDEFSHQHQLQSIKKDTLFDAQLAFFVQNRCRFKEYFS